ncbi:hypothetical protein [Enterocloster bolteae]|uniref:hypothetical protein n=1 Tax=Enterocloster bolteae TaxID=208479 RepID=UPI001FABA911|nr:hypothetical protein [Enterocloster bolteae]
MHHFWRVIQQKYAEETGDSSTPVLVVSTASPYKFAGSVLSALTGNEAEGDSFQQLDMLSSLTGKPVPEPIQRLREKKVRFQNVCEPDGMTEAVLAMLH